jgi:hypothetical protein
MAVADAPKSPATLRAERAAEKARRAAKDKERAADRARIELLKRQKADEKRIRDGLKWGPEWSARSKKIREYDAELRTLRNKKYE